MRLMTIRCALRVACTSDNSFTSSKSEGPSLSTVWGIESLTESAFTCWKLTIETLEQGLKYVQSY